MSIEKVVYIAVKGWEHHLACEMSQLSSVQQLFPGGWLAPKPSGGAGDPVWFQNQWLEPEILPFESISEAAKLLRARNGLWVEHIFQCHRRAALIKELLPHFRPKPLNFLSPLPKAQIGAWTLLDKGTLLCSRTTSSPFPGGRAEFVLPHEQPPSMAYLKLLEALTLIQHYYGIRPQAGQRCLDAGACPGGWTWILTQLGCQVLAVDRSPLDARLQQYSSVTFLRGDGFKVTPARLKREGWARFDWIVSDMAAYPAKALEWVQIWLEEPIPPNMIITLKLQGEPDWNTIRTFQTLPGGTVVHLFHNKHELTFFYVGPSS